MFSFLPKSILTKLVLIIVFIFTLGFIFFIWYMIPILKQEVNTLTHKQQTATAKYIVNVINKKITHDLTHISALAKSIDAQKLQNPIYIREFINRQSDFSNLFRYGMAILDEKGKIIKESLKKEQRKTSDFSKTKWFKKLQTRTKPLISSPFKGGVKNEPMINIAAPILDKNNKFKGAIFVSSLLDNRGFLSFLYNKAKGDKSRFIIISPKDKLFVASNVKGYALKPTPAKGVNKMRDKAMAGYRGVGTTVDEKGNEMILAIRSILSTGWFVVVAMPASEAYQIINSFVDHIKILGIIFIIIISSALIAIVFILLKPLKELSLRVRSFDPSKKAIAPIPLKNKDEIGDLIIGFNTLIDTVNKYTSKLEKLARRDGLTEVYNRRFFDEKLYNLWHVKIRSKEPLSLIMIDIDYFKDYNDTYGHQEGDDCLKMIAKRIQGCLRRVDDILCRYGGEEFAVIISGDEKQAINLAQKIKSAIYEQKYKHENSPFKVVTISLGISSLTPNVDQECTLLIKQADEALYKSKKTGRNQFNTYVKPGN